MTWAKHQWGGGGQLAAVSCLPQAPLAPGSTSGTRQIWSLQHPRQMEPGCTAVLSHKLLHRRLPGLAADRESALSWLNFVEIVQKRNETGKFSIQLRRAHGQVLCQFLQSERA